MGPTRKYRQFEYSLTRAIVCEPKKLFVWLLWRQGIKWHYHWNQLCTTPEHIVKAYNNNMYFNVLFLHHITGDEIRSLRTCEYSSACYLNYHVGVLVIFYAYHVC